MDLNFTFDWRRVDWARTALLIALILSLAAVLWQYAMPEIRTVTTTEFRRVPVIQTVKDVKYVRVACPEQGIVTLDKADVAKKLDLNWLQGGDIAAARLSEQPGGESSPPGGTYPSTPLRDRSVSGVEPPVPGAANDLQVTATAELPRSDNGTQVISVINTQTGESTIVAKETPAPWFQFRNDRAIGVRYGLNQHLVNVGNVYGKWGFLRIKSIWLSTYADLATGGDAQLQLGAEYRW